MLRSPDNKSVMSRIMLRFRPIAPKPASGGGSSSGEADPEMWKRAKRKYVRARGRRGKQSACAKQPSPEKSTIEVETPPARAGVTLQLLPERSEEISYSSDLRTSDSGCGSWPPAVRGGEISPPGIRRVGSAIETLIIVERVTEGFEDVGLGFSDDELVRSMERDTCPGFISDPRNNVIWVNEAYRKMVGAGEKGFVAVWLVVQDVLPQFYPSFACRVRVVVQRGGQGQNWNKILPCDVWRMVESHGFAWKLDVNTALSLSI
ncbi:Unknown protein [Striga hermonthica]|uniref:DUF7950 domain-containing protein n=1 Tax=Striga hermonthica TaxID=68872 RepID=A0A9N7RDT5_STRHE|nr:Unknown protein [Striga hermonthica]